MHLADLLVIAVYMTALVLVGLRLSRRQQTTEAYFIADRAIPGWAAGISVLATIITSVTFIAYPGAAYAGNWSLLVPGLMFVLVLALIGIIIIPFFRHTVTMSVYEYFGKRFGKGVRVYASLAFAVGHFAKMGFVVYLLALTVSGITGWRIDIIIVLLGAITIFYTLIGGLETVIWTDVLQGFVLAAGIVASIAFLLFSPRVSAGSMLHLIARNHKTSLGNFHFNLHLPTFWTLALYGIFFYLQKYTADQTVVQRYLVARTDRSAMRGIAMGALLCVPVWTAFMFIGSLLWAFYRITGDHLPSTITRPDQIFPYFMVTQMPAGVAGLFLAALFGAAMSMLASDLNCLAAIVVEDYYGLFFPGRTDRQRLRFGKGSVAVCGVLAIGVALQLTATHGGILSLYYTVTAIIAGGLAGLFLLAFLSRKASTLAASVGIVAAMSFTVWATLTMNGGMMLNLHRWNYPWNEYTIGAVANVLLLLVGLVTSQFFPATIAANRKLTLWDWLAAEMRSAPTQQGSMQMRAGD